MDDYPVKAQGMGGRQVRTGKDSGQIFDHHAVEFTYGNGHKLLSHCRHIRNCWNSVNEYTHGSKGYSDIGRGRIFDKDGNEIFKCKEGKGQRGGHQQEHHDLFADIRAGILPNEAEYGAKSTMTSIFGRLATYTGKELTWDDAINSDLSLCDVDALRSMNDEAPVKPDGDGNYPIPVPGAGYKDVIDWEPGKKPQKEKRIQKEKAPNSDLEMFSRIASEAPSRVPLFLDSSWNSVLPFLLDCFSECVANESVNLWR
jgi:myo-inositol 2-dehydrogenase/D-chiro-inositol 1-dehydrogenase